MEGGAEGSEPHIFPRLASMIALQLYSVREVLANDFFAGLRRVREIGYEYVEFAGFGGHSGSEVSNELVALGLKAAGAHVGMEVFDNPSAVIADMILIGATNATCPGLPPEMRSSPAAWEDSADKLEATAHKFLEHGISFGYHNHAFEFNDGGFSTLVNRTKVLKFQLDVYWAAKAERDPAEMIRSLTGRLQSLHCKDMARDGKDIEVGDGMLDWHKILGAAKDAGVSVFITEMDNPRGDAFASAQRSYEGLLNALSSLQ